MADQAKQAFFSEVEKFHRHSLKMRNPFQNLVTGVPINSSESCRLGRPVRGYLPNPANQCHLSSSNVCSTFKQSKVDSVFKRMMSKLGKKADSFAEGVREHVRLGANISETVKGKFSLGAKILQVGGVEKIFRLLFRVEEEEEKLQKVSQCYLSTTAGPIAGLLFISTYKVAFCSERSIKFSSASGKSVRIHYKVLIPLAKVKRVDRSENVKKPSQKYMEIATVDGFDFWFMGFFNYQKTLKCLQQALAVSLNTDD
ncbi:GEM-like protein 4 isoform X2 [Manihot esculenta]|uniref:GEM-like protein 4 isoform X2 n=1 Tax=Manihot esculenta TaxID=3983 RepID=UPI000B5D2AF4|nr:GEM-like protein 4 isoform X2 [Manihot esculenta]